MVEFKAEPDSVPGERRMGPGRPRKAPTKVVPNIIPEKELRDALVQNLAFLSLGVGLLDRPCAERKEHNSEHVSCNEAVLEHAETIADSLVEASKKNPAIRRVLNMMVTGGVFGQVAFAFMPLVVTVATNHVPALQVSRESSSDG